MPTSSSVLRLLSDFGDAAGWLIAAVVLFAHGRRIIQENEKAHAAITENVKKLDTKIDTVATELNTKIETVATGAQHQARRHREGRFLPRRPSDRARPTVLTMTR